AALRERDRRPVNSFGGARPFLIARVPAPKVRPVGQVRLVRLVRKTNPPTMPTNTPNGDLRLPAEILFTEELEALTKAEKHPVPTGWRMSPRSVLTYICGGKAGKLDVTPKYIGHQRLVEIAISTLVTDRALLLLGEPGTAKSWLSEHLAAAINGDSTKVVQGTAGTTEEQIRYTWKIG